MRWCPISRAAEAEETEEIPRIAVVGKPNVGKSSLINKLTGENQPLCRISPGTTRDAIDTKVKYHGKEYGFCGYGGSGGERARSREELERFSSSGLAAGRKQMWSL